MKWYKPYLTYKPSGVEWLCEIPEHWKLRRLKSVITNAINGAWGEEPKGDENDIVCVRVADFDYANLGISSENLTLRNIDSSQQFSRGLKKGDLLIEKSGGGENQSVGRVVSYNIEERAVSSNFIARLLPHKDVHYRFLCYVFAAMYAVEYNIRSIRQTTGIQNLDLYSYLCEEFALPSLQEQRAIAAFLDRETTRIDTLITKKRELINLLQKKRATVITNAVTKGINPQVTVKDSGLEWIVKIPAHWEVKRLKFTAQVQTGLTLGKNYDGRNVINRPYLRVANVQDGFLDLQTITEVSIPVEDVLRYQLKFGDVLMTEGGDFDKLGRGYIWEGQIEGCLHQNHVFAVRPYSEYLNSHYLSALITSHYGKAYFTSTSQQTTNLATTNRTKLCNFPLPLPDITEQEDILIYIEKKNLQILLTINKLQEQINALQAYRSALITAAVTGKIDLREEVNKKSA